MIVNYHLYDFILAFSYFSIEPFYFTLAGFPGGSDGKESACNAGDLGSIPASGRSRGEGNGNHSSIHAWRIPWAEVSSGL